MYDAGMFCPKEQRDDEILERIFERFNIHHPADYRGGSLSVSDVVELYDGAERRYFYCDSLAFTPIGFSPMLAKPMKNDSQDTA